MSEKFEVIQIGEVRTKIDDSKFNDSKKRISQLVIFEEFVEALEKIEEYSHIIVIYWAHLIESKERKLRKVNPGGFTQFSERGVFSSRSQARPNPICFTTVKLLLREENILYVENLDALNKSPIIDIKPYTPQFDRPILFEPPIWSYCFRKMKETTSLEK
ncbi:MAG: S-adenosyl-L-methionine-binding protein [Promethearchaeota archaeon]|jgi:tRNA-Thr(GGU) m(6)t(6)A37 methyltransferase TsaA|nr:MAG: S-adenosyl-L-methionine-binding protein [Candidatus Lokiarchaeota archaeon]